MMKFNWSESLGGFLGRCFSVVSRRRWFLISFSWLFFIFLIVGAVLASFGFVRVFPLFLDQPIGGEVDNALVMVLVFFLFNLVMSGFLLLTASGILFFGVPVGFLLLRGLLWGVFWAALPVPWAFAIFPTLILEGEGYVFAAVAGLDLGLSWFKPKWMFKEESFSRVEAFRRAVRECAYIYVFVVMLLLAAAIVETATLIFAT